MLFIQKLYYYLCRYFPVILVAVTVLFWISMYFLNISKEKKDPEITSVPEVTKQELREKLPEATESEIKDIDRRIRETKEEKAPTYHYYTKTQEAADEKAREYAREQKADKIIKTTKVKEIEKPGNNDDSKKSQKDTVIENDYYAINMERKHNITLGSTYVDHNSYVTASYRNRDVTYTALYGINNHEVGIGVAVTVAKW